MTRIGCRAHDYGKLPAAALAATLRAKGYNAAQLAMPRAIAGIEDFSHITDQQLAEIRTAFAAQDVEISVLSCYQDLSAPDADIRRTAVDTVKRTLGCAKVLGAKMVGSETAWGACTDEEKAARRHRRCAVSAQDDRHCVKVKKLPNRFAVGFFRILSAIPIGRYVSAGFGAYSVVGGLQVVEAILHQPLGGKGFKAAADHKNVIAGCGKFLLRLLHG